MTAVVVPAGGKQAGARRRPGDGQRLAGVQVNEIQRSRMLRAMAEVAAERGAMNATVAQVVARSGVSRRTFYDLFEDREDCFMAAFEDALGQIAEQAAVAYGAAGRWEMRIRAALVAILGFIEEEPDQGRLCVVESLVAGPRASERRAQVTQVLVDAIEEGRREAKAGQEPPALTAEGLVGAVLAVLYARLVAHATSGLTKLVNPFMSMIVLPYLGAGAARREANRPQPKPSKQAGARRRDPLRDLDMRLTYRTVRVLMTISSNPGSSNRKIAQDAGVADQGQISKLLLRLQNLGLIENGGVGPTRGEPNAWQLTDKGQEIQQAINQQTSEAVS